MVEPVWLCTEVDRSQSRSISAIVLEGVRFRLGPRPVPGVARTLPARVAPFTAALHGRDALLARIEHRLEQTVSQVGSRSGQARLTLCSDRQSTSLHFLLWQRHHPRIGLTRNTTPLTMCPTIQNILFRISAVQEEVRGLATMKARHSIFRRLLAKSQVSSDDEGTLG